MKIYDEQKMRTAFLHSEVSRSVLVSAIVLAFLYFYFIAFAFIIGDKLAFYLLVLGEIFHVYQILMYVYTMWNTKIYHYRNDSFHPAVDVFITVAGEPASIVEETIKAAKEMEYPNKTVYVLNDGRVTGKENWKEINLSALRLGVASITRTEAKGAKAGNINNALSRTSGELVVIFDADHVPHKDFLKKTVGYFADPKMAFVQTPQFYKNFAESYITRGAWEQQQLYFGPILRGKNRVNAATMCGTNLVIRRQALLSVGGMDESITEDFSTSMFLHENGWKSYYLPLLLAEGLAPRDILSYFQQQLRWARGSLEVLFRHDVLFRKNLSLGQKLQYLYSISFYFSGVVILIDALIPIVFLLGGGVPIISLTMKLAAIFLPYIFLTLYMLQQSSNFSFTFRALAFSMSSFTVHLRALLSFFSGKKPQFVVTPKQEQKGNFLPLVLPHLSYVALVIFGMIFAYFREGFSASYFVNSAWAILNVSVFLPFIYSAMPKKVLEQNLMGEGRETYEEFEIPAIPEMPQIGMQSRTIGNDLLASRKKTLPGKTLLNT